MNIINQSFSIESLVEVTNDYHKIEKAFSRLEEGLETYDTVKRLYNLVDNSKYFSVSLENSVALTLQSCKEVVGDYSRTIAFEDFKSPERKRSLALEGLGDFLNNIWKAIVDFFKRIYNWIFNKNKSSTSSAESTFEQEKQKEKAAEDFARSFAEEAKNKEKERRDKEHANWQKSVDEREAKRKAQREADDALIKKAQDIADEILKKARLAEEEIEKNKKSDDVEFLKKKEAKLLELKESIDKKVTSFVKDHGDCFKEINERISQYKDKHTFFEVMANLTSSLIRTSRKEVLLLSKIIDNTDKVLKNQESRAFTEKGVYYEFVGLSQAFDGVNPFVMKETKNQTINENFEEVCDYSVPLYDNKILRNVYLKNGKNLETKQNLVFNIDLRIETVEGEQTSKIKEEVTFNTDDSKSFEKMIDVEKEFETFKTLWKNESGHILKFAEKMQSNVTSMEETNEKENKAIILVLMKSLLAEAKVITKAQVVIETIIPTVSSIFKKVNKNNRYIILLDALSNYDKDVHDARYRTSDMYKK